MNKCCCFRFYIILYSHENGLIKNVDPVLPHQCITPPMHSLAKVAA